MVDTSAFGAVVRRLSGIFVFARPLRRRKVRFVPFPQKRKLHTLPCSSFPHKTHFVGLLRGPLSRVSVPIFPNTRLLRRIGVKGICSTDGYERQRAGEAGQVWACAPVKRMKRLRCRSGGIHKGATLMCVFGDFCRITKVTPAERRSPSETK